MVTAIERDKELTDREEGASRARRMKETLTRAFSPTALEIEDQSGAHSGHSGARPGGETHFRVRMTAEAFAGLSRIERQRAVQKALAAEFEAGLHALALDLKAPQEA